LLGAKAKLVPSNKLERYIKEEVQKHTFVESVMEKMRELKPILYQKVQPTELQITCFLKGNAKVAKDALVAAGSDQEPTSLVPKVVEAV
jgi:hypothetical protein